MPVKTLLPLFAALAALSSSTIFAEDRPNVVFILTDDQRADALSIMGHPHLKTPRIDQLAEEGVLFKTASQYLGLLYYNKGEKKKAYEWLLPMKDSLSMEGTLVMHDSAFVEKD